MKKYIFLDIDGVFNNVYTKEFINEQAMDHLAYIIVKTNAKLVIISSQSANWIREDYYCDENFVKRRIEFETKLIKSCEKLGLNYDFAKVDFIDKYFNLHELNKDIINLNGLYINDLKSIKLKYYGSRQYKIDEYLKYYHKDNLAECNYIVIDDTSDFYNENNHIMTSAFDEDSLLKEEDAKKAVSILNR